MTTPPRILHLISGLGFGGAETALLRLIPPLREFGFDSRILCLGPDGPLRPSVERLGIPVDCLGARGLTSLAPLWRRFSFLIRESNPNLLQTWMYHADLTGFIAHRLSRLSAPLVWNVRSGRPDLPGARMNTKATILACRLIARRGPQAVVFCSRESRERHCAAGYPGNKSVIIPNGFDASKYTPNPDLRAAMRRGLSLPEHAPLIGVVARFDQTKDYETFVRTIGLVGRSLPEARFLAAGEGVDAANPLLKTWIERENIGSRLLLLGHRKDVPELLQALDLFLLTSRTEGFPNVVGEAMAGGVPCVVTNVGDSALLVGTTGAVTPPRDAGALAEACLRLLAESPASTTIRRQEARRRIQAQFNLESTAAQYAQLYRNLLGLTPPATA